MAGKGAAKRGEVAPLVVAGGHTVEEKRENGCRVRVPRVRPIFIPAKYKESHPIKVLRIQRFSSAGDGGAELGRIGSPVIGYWAPSPGGTGEGARGLGRFGSPRIGCRASSPGGIKGGAGGVGPVGRPARWLLGKSPINFRPAPILFI